MLRWLKARGYYFASQEAYLNANCEVPLNYLLMDGGNLAVPEKELPHFYERYDAAVKAGEKLFFVEIKSAPLYCFFLDLDFPANLAKKVPKPYEIARCLKPSHPLIITGVRDEAKKGYHLHWYKHHVTTEQANQLTEKVTCLLEARWPNLPWRETIVDLTVLKGSGLRLPGSWKMDPKKNLSPRIYDCLGVYKKRTGQLLPKLTHELQTNLPLLLHHISIRTPHHSTPHTSKKRKRSHIDKKVTGSWPLAQTFFTKHVPHAPQIVSIKRCPHGTGCYYINTNCQHCGNKPKPHRSVTIWYLYNPKTNTLSQRCFCTHPTLGIYGGPCRNFRGKPISNVPNLGL